MASNLRRLSMKLSKVHKDAMQQQLTISGPTDLIQTAPKGVAPKRLSELQMDQLSLMDHSSLAIFIGSLVKDGQLDQNEAMSKFSELSQSLPPQMMTRKQDDKADISYSIKNKKDNMNYTMKFDLKNKTINLYWKGKCKYRYSFEEEIKSYESEEGNTFTITLSSLETLEFEAEELEEKNAILDVLGRFKDLNEKLKEGGTLKNKNQPESLQASTILECSVGDTSDLSVLDTCPIGGLPYLRSPPKIDITASLRIPVVKPLFKFGELEKKGHGKGGLTYPIRYVEIKTGQLAYFKPSDKTQPLNILTIDQNTIIESDGDEFKIRLLSKGDKSYQFRVPRNDRGTIDDWLRALDFAREGKCDNGVRASVIKIDKHSSLPRRKQANKIKTTLEEILHVPIDGPPKLNLDDTNLGRLICELKHQISFLQLMTTEDKVSKINDVTSNLISICNFMDDQIRQNPSDEVYFHPINRLGSYSSRNLIDSNSFEQNLDEIDDVIADLPQVEPVVRKVSSNIQRLSDILEQSLTEKTTINLIKEAQFSEKTRLLSATDLDQVNNEIAQKSLESDNEQNDMLESTVTGTIKIDQNGPQAIVHPDNVYLSTDFVDESIGLNFSVVHSIQIADPPIEFREKILNAIPAPPPSLPEAVDYYLKIDQVNTLNSMIPCCPPNMPEAIEKIKKEFGIVTIPDPPPNMPGVGDVDEDSSTSGAMYQMPTKISRSKMRLVAWDKIPNGQLRFESVWLRNMQGTSEIDFDKLELQFKDKKIATNKSLVRAKPKIETILDDKRGMAISIFLKNFGVNKIISSNEDSMENLKANSTGEKSKIDYIDEKLNLVDESNGGYSQDILEELTKYPTDEDVELFKRTKIKPENMVEFDKFVYTICNITFYKERLEILTKIRDIPIECSQTIPLIQKLQLACDVLKDNAELDRVLMIVLTIGNYINGSNTRGNASGFKLSYLPKLVDYRGNDIKYSLLHFLTHHIITNEKDLIYFYEKLQPVNSATDASVEGILAEVELIEKRLKKIKSTAKKIEERKGLKFAEFLEGVDSFCKLYEEKINELRLQYNLLKDSYTNLLNKYGESDQLESDEFFGYISYFIRDFKRVSTEILKKINQETRNKELEQERLAANNNKSNKNYKRANTFDFRKTKQHTTVTGSQEDICNSPPGNQIAEAGNNSEIKNNRAGAFRNHPSVNVVKMDLGVLQIEKNGKWKSKEFRLNGKELISTKGKKKTLDDKIVLSSKLEANIDAKDPTILNIKVGKEFQRLKLPNAENAKHLLKDITHNASC